MHADMLLILVRVDSTALKMDLFQRGTALLPVGCSCMTFPKCSLLSSILNNMYMSPLIKKHIELGVFLVCSILAVCVSSDPDSAVEFLSQLSG